MPLVYDELRRLAARYLRKSPFAIEPGTLVHELYLRLVGIRSPECANRTQFFALAAVMMRRILVDHYRARSASKHGGNSIAITLDESVAALGPPQLDLIALDSALNELAAFNPKGARLIELRFFVGMTLEEAAGILGISSATAKRQWAASRAWIHARLDGQIQ